MRVWHPIPPFCLDRQRLLGEHRFAPSWPEPWEPVEVMRAKLAEKQA
jgi:hypothetical protein